MAQPVRPAIEELEALAQSSPVDLRVEADARGVSLHLKNPRLSWYHSFVIGALAKRSRQTDQALLRACNNKQRSLVSVLDLTAGWGADSLALARQGRQVRLLEQNSLLAGILEYSLGCLAATDAGRETAARMRVECANSAEFLLALDDSDGFDCIYLDPMFPAHKSSARPAKEMQILQAMTGNSDIEQCFELALARARRRVVVKRPAKAPGLHESKPDIVYRETSVRFDVYLTA